MTAFPTPLVLPECEQGAFSSLVNAEGLPYFPIDSQLSTRLFRQLFPSIQVCAFDRLENISHFDLP